MKVTFLLALFIGLTSSLFSQNKRFSLSTNLLNLAVSGPSASLSYQYTPKLAFQVYGSTGNFNKYLPSSDYQFKTAILDVKYSPLDRLYVGPYLRYIDKRVQREGYVDHTGFISVSERDFHGKGISSGLLLGFKIPDTRFVNVEIFGGGGIGTFVRQRDYSGQEKQSAFLDGRVGILAGLKF
ncbi:DUF3575 domain-containing protein [Desertivirga arenae]|uniref:DUF3575 domain-containing protein n=1 Tax=Desertivirga arenae TaxID=2810309 RepID=UPI001A97C48F|nr:DUF3575 domain-containing protein [Pedobacter sp. SYSU D00823]